MDPYRRLRNPEAGDSRADLANLQTGKEWLLKKNETIKDLKVRATESESSPSDTE